MCSFFYQIGPKMAAIVFQNCRKIFGKAWALYLLTALRWYYNLWNMNDDDQNNVENGLTEEDFERSRIVLPITSRWFLLVTLWKFDVPRISLSMLAWRTPTIITRFSSFHRRMNQKWKNGCGKLRQISKFFWRLEPVLGANWRVYVLSIPIGEKDDETAFSESNHFYK